MSASLQPTLFCCKVLVQEALDPVRGDETVEATRSPSEAYLGGEVVLLQLPSFPEVPGAHRVIQAPRPEFGAVV